MLPSIDLQLTGINAANGDFARVRPLTPGTAAPEASFAERLRAPIPVAAAPPGGQPLPLQGNGLPFAGNDWAAQLSGRSSLSSEANETGLLTHGRSEHDLRAQHRLQRLLTIAEDLAEDVQPPIIVLSAQPLTALRRMPLSHLQPVTAESLGSGSMSQSGPGIEGLRQNIAALVESSAGNGGRAADHSQGAYAVAGQVDRDLSITHSTRVERPLGTGEATQSVILTSTPGASTTSPVAAQGILATPQASAATTPAVETTITLPILDQAWGEVLSERVAFMSNHRIQSAEIRLTPPELGPIRVNVAMEDGATNVSFNVQNPLTREAIESALPRLREMLSENGLSLGDTSVSDHGVSRDDNRLGSREAAERADDTLEHAADDVAALPASGRARITRGLVDTFV